MRGKPRLDLTGQRFGALVVKEIDKSTTYRKVRWLCNCDCGATHCASTSSLRGGKVASCGCTKAARISAARTIHGDSRSSKPRAAEYVVWCQIKGRCTNSSLPGYKHYGARGITLCDRWLQYENFIADMGRRPSPKHTIERKNGKLGYSPDNCVWATRDVQNNNTSRNHRLVYKGKDLTLAQWAKLRRLKPTTLRMRLKVGWDLERALTTPA